MMDLNKLKSFNLPIGKYAIFGSGPMAIRGIRESHDLDIIVKEDLWNELLDKHFASLLANPTCIKIDEIEIYRDWLDLTNRINEMIDTAEIISEHPFVRLEYVVEWKKQMGREKDVKDIELIQKYLKINK